MRRLLLTTALAAGLTAPAQADGYFNAAVHMLLAGTFCDIPVSDEDLGRAFMATALEADIPVDRASNLLAETAATIAHEISASPEKQSAYCGYVYGKLSAAGVR